MDNKFKYTYAAPSESERREINSIRKNYLPKERQEESKIDRLRKLDNRVKNAAFCISLTIGIIGTLLFGLGLTFALEWGATVAGIIISVIALVPVFLAYPVYKWVLNKSKNKYAKEILRLSDEILNDYDKES